MAGTGRVERAADIAHATFVVEASRETAAEARGVAAEAVSAVLAALAQAGVAADDLRTAGLDVQPTWDHDGNRPVRTGFTVANRIAVAVRDLERVGTVVDAALRSGANGLDGLRFELADPVADMTEARRLAVFDARQRATTIAEAAGRSLGPLVAIAEGGAPVPLARREARLMSMAADAPPTPVIPGSVEISVTVTAEWELAERD
ncbi:MAG TPA: SIMPL domain-containing protein [Candidatus Limnocylindrales bacterium]|nr:SIMPL domain-containing protein [Candidatus Limnocylindrales bacterium]